MDIERLPLPRSGKITHAIHIADVHIRAGDDAKSRRAEYASVFDALMLSLRAMECVAGGSAVIVVAGDVFHDKGRIEPPGIALFDTLLGLADIAPLYIIRGNHDYRQDDPETMDLISALVGRRSGNVAYLDRTGLYDAGNVGFGLLAIQDVLQPGATSGDVTRKDRPPFPDPSPLVASSPPKDALVALFHGMVSRARLPNGQLLEKGAAQSDAARSDAARSDGCDTSTFAQYDIAMLGDVHEMQVSGAVDKPVMTAPAAPPSVSLFSKSFQSDSGEDRARCCWAYSGSLVQQNFGESLFRHGFLLWDLERREVHGYHVPNSRGMLNVERRAGQFMCPLSGLGARIVPLRDLVNHDACPASLSLKIPCDIDVAQENELGAVIEAAGKNVTLVRRGLTQARDERDDSSATDISHLANYSGPAAWIEYVAGKSANSDDALARVPWRDWFVNTDAACVPTSTDGPLPESLIADLVRPRNEKIMAKGRNAAAIVTDACSRRRAFQLLRVDFSWMFCYGPDMYVDFRDMSGRVVALTAKNGAGKSSLLETICYAVFGEGFPSRSTTPYTAAVICHMKPSSEKAWTRVQFQTNGNTYVLRRSFSSDATRLQVRDATLLQWKKDTGSQETVREGSKSVREWLTTHVGSIDAFLMACMLTQGGDRDFFALRPREQKAAISKALALDAADAVFDVFHEAKLAHAAVADNLHAAISAMRSKEALIPSIEQRDVDDSVRLERHLADERTKATDAVQSARERMGNAFADIVRTMSTDRSLDEYARDVQGRLRDACDKACCDERTADTASQQLAVLRARLLAERLPDKRAPIEHGWLLLEDKTVDTIERLAKAVVAYSDGLDCDVVTAEEDESALARARERLEATLRDSDESLAATRLRDCSDMHSLNVRRLEEIVAEQPPVPISLGRKRPVDDKGVDELDSALRALRIAEPGVPRDKTQEEVAASLAKRDVWMESYKELATADTQRLATILADARERLDLVTEIHEIAEDVARTFRAQADSARAAWKSLDSEYRAHERCKPAESTISPAEFEFWQTRKRAVLTEGIELLQCEDPDMVLHCADARIAEYERNVDRTRRLVSARQDALREISAEREHPFNPECRACQARQRLDSEANTRWAIVAESTRELQDLGGDSEQCWSTLLQRIHDWRKEVDAVLSKEDFHEEHARRRADFDAWKDEQRRLQQTRDEVFESIAAHEDRHRATQRILVQMEDALTIVKTRLNAIASFVSRMEAWRALDIDGMNEAWRRHREWKQEVECLQQRRDDAVFWAQFDAATETYVAWQTRKEHALSKRLESERELALAKTNLETIASKRSSLRNTIDYIARVQESATIRRRCMELEEIVRAKRERDELQRLADALPHYQQYEEHAKRLTEIDATLEDAIRNTTTLKLRMEAKHDAAREIAKYAEALRLVSERRDALERLCQLGQEFKTWVFDTKVTAIIQHQVNSLLEYSDHADLRLVARMHGDDIQWFVRNGASCPPIDKASGFQRFVIGFAMRIALGRIGAVDVACKQLFVDEGFVACDADNLARVPSFLHALVERFFDSIVLVSHLDQIKDAADVRIPIRVDTGISRIRFGRTDDWIEPDAAKGRPHKRKNKNSRIS